ncbi:hypothetical protein ACERNI_05975 [Camelimonas sp. ID_303_24]
MTAWRLKIGAIGLHTGWSGQGGRRSREDGISLYPSDLMWLPDTRRRQPCWKRFIDAARTAFDQSGSQAALILLVLSEF